MLLSSRHRLWKALAALLLFYAGGLYHHRTEGQREPPIWTYPGDPDRYDGRRYWLIGERISSVAPDGGTLQVAPGRYRVTVLVPPGTLPEGAASDALLYAVLRYDKARGFVLEPGAHTSPATPVKNLALYAVSIPALAFVLWVFFRRFRPSLSLGLTEASPDA